MKNILRISTIIFMLTLSTTSVFSQDEPNEAAFRKFGLGLHIEQFKTQDVMSSTIVPANKLILIMSPSNSFRVEPSIGFSKSQDEFGDTNYNGTQSSKGVYVGLGAFYMYQAGKTNLYFGLRIENGKISDKTEYSNNGYNDFNKTETKRFMFGPTIGAEYFLGRHLSFGGEFSLKNYSSKSTSTSTNNPSPSDENKNKYFSTDTGLLLRFYF
jgi:outer membrane protein with beta-barrel domain